jgi:hypothetical protein
MDAMSDVITDAMDDVIEPVPDAAAEPAQSGDRLKARWRVGSDGSREFAGWYDSGRSENCSFQLVNGSMRCLPAYGATASGYFSDASCTQPLFVGVGCASNYGMKTTVASNRCDSTSEFHQVAVVTPDVVYIQSGDTCVESVPSTALTYHSSTGVIAFDQFVSGTEEVDP